MKKEGKNYAFVDSQNINLGVRDLGWRLDWRRFRVFLRERYDVERAYLFLGYLPGNQGLYNSLQAAGFVLVFKPVAWDEERKKPKGNVDAELVLQAMIDFQSYERAVVVSSDGDFRCLVEHLHEKEKLELVISPKREHCSKLLLRAARGRIAFLDQFRTMLEYRPK
jgi:uncharacterized LabA/DUF88 family protein